MKWHQFNAGTGVDIPGSFGGTGGSTGCNVGTWGTSFGPASSGYTRGSTGSSVWGCIGGSYGQASAIFAYFQGYVPNLEFQYNWKVCQLRFQLMV